MNEDDVRALLRRMCDSAGSQKAFAESAGMTQSYVGDVLASRRGPGEKLLAALGLERVVSYRRTSPPQGESGRKRRGGA